MKVVISYKNADLDGVTFYFLFANHDFHTFSKKRELLDMVQERDDFKILEHMFITKAYLFYYLITVLSIIFVFQI